MKKHNPTKSKVPFINGCLVQHMTPRSHYDRKNVNEIWMRGELIVEDIDLRDNYTFTSALELIGRVRLNNGFWPKFRVVTTGETVTMLYPDFLDELFAGNLSGKRFYGTWTFRKHGRNFGVTRA